MSNALKSLLKAQIYKKRYFPNKIGVLGQLNPFFKIVDGAVTIFVVSDASQSERWLTKNLAMLEHSCAIGFFIGSCEQTFIRLSRIFPALMLADQHDLSELL